MENAEAKCLRILPRLQSVLQGKTETHVKTLFGLYKECQMGFHPTKYGRKYISSFET